MTPFLLILIFIATLVFLCQIAKRGSRYDRAYDLGQQIAEDHPDLHGMDLNDVQVMHSYQFGHDEDTGNGFWDGYKGNPKNEEGYDPDQDQDQESETIEEHLSWWQKANRK